MKKIYYLTVMEVRCPCGNTINIRSKERMAQVSCWNCKDYSVKLVQGYGAGNYSVYLVQHSTRKERKTSPSFVVQSRPSQKEGE